MVTAILTFRFTILNIYNTSRWPTMRKVENAAFPSKIHYFNRLSTASGRINLNSYSSCFGICSSFDSMVLHRCHAKAYSHLDSLNLHSFVENVIAKQLAETINYVWVCSVLVHLLHPGWDFNLKWTNQVSKLSGIDANYCSTLVFDFHLATKNTDLYALMTTISEFRNA